MFSDGGGGHEATKETATNVTKQLYKNRFHFYFYTNTIRLQALNFVIIHENESSNYTDLPYSFKIPSSHSLQHNLKV